MAAKTFQGTVKPHASFNAEHDAQIMNKAMTGAGTDEKAIVDVLAYQSNEQRLEIKLKYKALFGKDMEDDLHGELSSNFRQVILGLLQAPAAYDAEELHRAMKGGGTDEEALIEILATRSNDEILKIKSAYKLKFKDDLEKDLSGDTSGHFRRLLVSLSTGNRDEGTSADAARVKQDAQDLYKAGEKKLGTDESAFNQVLCTRSFAHIRAVIDEYTKVSKHTLEQAITSEMSGDLKQGMLAIVHVATNKQRFFAERLHAAMKGLGTRDNTLIRIVVSRSEVDMVQIMQEFQTLSGKSLESFISDDTSGDYKNALLALIKVKK